MVLVYLAMGQNPVPPMTLKSLLKGGNLLKRYPLGFDPQPFGYGSKRKPQRGPQVAGFIFPLTNRVFGVPFFDP